MAGPYPVVLVEAVLTNLHGRIHHQAHIGVCLFVEGIELVAAEIGDDAHTDVLFLGKSALLHQPVLEFSEEFLRLHGVGVGLFLAGHTLHLGGDIVNAYDKGKGQSGAGHLFLLRFCKESGIEVVVLHGGNLMYVGESAVVVGQDETVFADEFTGTSVSEDANDIAERG